MWQGTRAFFSLAAVFLTALAGCGGPVEDPEDADAISAPVISDGVLFAHFDEGAGASSFKDTSPAAHAITCNGAACPAAGGIGLFGSKNTKARKRAPEFDGSTSCLTVPDSAGLGAALPITYSMWMLPRSLPGANKWMAAMSKYREDAPEWILGVRSNASGTPRVTFWLGRDGTSSTALLSSTRVLGAADIGRWMHVALRIDASGAYEFHIDRQLAGSGTLATSPLFHGGAAVRIGCIDKSSVGPAAFFDGKLDEIVVARSAVPVSDLHALYDAAKPLTPSMQLMGGSFVTETSAQIDKPTRDELADRVRGLHGDVYRFMIRRDALCKNQTGQNCKDLSAVRSFLAENPDIDVIVDRNPFWATTWPSGESPTCAGKPSEPERWGCALGEMAKQYPNLVGWSIDDFFAERKGATGEYDSFMNRQNARLACKGISDAVAGSGRTLPISATIYCAWPGGSSFARPGGYPDMTDVASGWRKTSTTQDSMFVEYVSSDPTLRSCISAVSVYSSPVTLGASSDPIATINGCVDTLRPLQASAPRLALIEGVYVSSLSAHDISCAGRRADVGFARATVPDGYSFYQMPAPDDAACPGYGWLGGLAANPGSFVTW